MQSPQSRQTHDTYQRQQPVASKKLDPVTIVLGTLMGLGIVLNGLAFLFFNVKSTPYHITQIVWYCSVALFNFYTGIKKFRQRKARGERVHWYTQAGILFGIGGFLFIAMEIYILFSPPALIASLDALPLAVLLALFLPPVLFWLAAGFFFIRRFMGYERPKVP